MIGALLGDIIGSVFEGKNLKTTDFQLHNFGSRITDDSVLTIAVADALLNNRDYEQRFLLSSFELPVRARKTAEKFPVQFEEFGETKDGEKHFENMKKDAEWAEDKLLVTYGTMGSASLCFDLGYDK